MLWLCPAKRNPLKSDPTGASAEDRAEMARLAVAALSDGRVRLLDFEIKAEGPSYTLLTVQHLKQKEGCEVAVVMGSEVFATLPNWYHPQELVNEADLFIVSREPIQPSQIEQTVGEIGLNGLRPLGEKWEHGVGRWITLRTISALPFSATAIRQSLRRSKQRPEGLADGVWTFIKQRRLYADK